MTAAEIRAARERLGYSQADLAEALGVTQQAVSWWETGRGEPEPWVAADLARHEARQEATRMLAEGRVPDDCAECAALREACSGPLALLRHTETCPACLAITLRLMWGD